MFLVPLCHIIWRPLEWSQSGSLLHCYMSSLWSPETVLAARQLLLAQDALFLVFQPCPMPQSQYQCGPQWPVPKSFIIFAWLWPVRCHCRTRTQVCIYCLLPSQFSLQWLSLNWKSPSFSDPLILLGLFLFLVFVPFQCLVRCKAQLTVILLNVYLVNSRFVAKHSSNIRDSMPVSHWWPESH